MSSQLRKCRLFYVGIRHILFTLQFSVILPYLMNLMNLCPIKCASPFTTFILVNLFSWKHNYCLSTKNIRQDQMISYCVNTNSWKWRLSVKPRIGIGIWNEGNDGNAGSHGGDAGNQGGNAGNRRMWECGECGEWGGNAENQGGYVRNRGWKCREG